MTKGIFIAGTGTDVGKTVVTAGLMYLLISSGYKACYFKAALSGAEEVREKLIPGDAKFVKEVSGLKENYENIIPYIYKTAVSPHLASKIENNIMDIKLVLEKFNELKNKYDYIIVEGSGGIVCPLIEADDNIYLLENLIKDLNMETIVVATASLGTINHTVITVNYIESLGIKVKGIIINAYENNFLCDDNIKIIKKLTKKPIIAVIPKIDALNEDNSKIEKLKEEVLKVMNAKEFITYMDKI